MAHHLRAKPEDAICVYHGTTLENGKKIMEEGFKVGGRSGHIAANGTALGCGVYTGIGPDVPLRYSFSTSGGGSGVLVLALALKGRTVGHHERDGGDSWTGTGDVVVFKDARQLLPKYLLHF